MAFLLCSLQDVQISARTDVWSLGLVLCEICTSRYPFSGSTEVAISRYLSGPARRAFDVMKLLKLPDDTPGTHFVHVPSRAFRCMALLISDCDARTLAIACLSHRSWLISTCVVLRIPAVTAPTDELLSIIAQCLAWDPSERPVIEVIEREFRAAFG